MAYTDLQMLSQVQGNACVSISNSACGLLDVWRLAEIWRNKEIHNAVSSLPHQQTVDMMTCRYVDRIGWE